jgi:putative peptide-modifying radical SAM enzyme
VIGFYGGEPLLNLDLMYKVLDNIPARAYNLQTNATHLTKVKDRYLEKIDTILVSIDGDKETTDRCWGEGTYDTIIGNLRDVQDREYGGDIVARMAYSINGDIYQDVKYLLELRYPEFEHVHWQLDVFWNSLEKWDDFEYWMRRYEKGISLLVKDWVRGLETGEVIGIVPFIPVAKTLLTGEPVKSIRCGSRY